MTQQNPDDGAWFAPKRYGYGAGLPITWQGWLATITYIAVIAGIPVLDDLGTEGSHVAAFALFLLATSVFLVILARRTRGGWKWRWGKKG